MACSDRLLRLADMLARQTLICGTPLERSAVAAVALSISAEAARVAEMEERLRPTTMREMGGRAWRVPGGGT